MSIDWIGFMLIFGIGIFLGFIIRIGTKDKEPRGTTGAAPPSVASRKVLLKDPAVQKVREKFESLGLGEFGRHIVIGAPIYTPEWMDEWFRDCAKILDVPIREYE